MEKTVSLDDEIELDLISKYICVTLKSKIIICGECFTIDPVTKSFVLITEIQTAPDSFQLQIILYHAIAKWIVGIPPMSFNTVKFNEYKKNILCLLSGATINNKSYSVEDMLERKNIMKEWLELNRLPVTLLNDGIISVVNGLALIEPPYIVDSCRSTNTIVLDRVMRIVKSCPEVTE